MIDVYTLSVQFICWFWIGFVGAISFMEAWLKFRAQGVPVTMALRIGKVVFKGLNRVEIALVLTLIILVAATHAAGHINSSAFGVIPIAFIVIFQFVYLLPKMSGRADLIFEGRTVSNSRLHFTYVGLEILKVCCLAFVSISIR